MLTVRYQLKHQCCSYTQVEKYFFKTLQLHNVTLTHSREHVVGEHKTWWVEFCCSRSLWKDKEILAVAGPSCYTTGDTTVANEWLSVAFRQRVHSGSVQYKAKHMTATRQRLFASCCAGMWMSIDNEITVSMWWCQRVCRLETDWGRELVEDRYRICGLKLLINTFLHIFGT